MRSSYAGAGVLQLMTTEDREKVQRKPVQASKAGSTRGGRPCSVRGSKIRANRTDPMGRFEQDVEYAHHDVFQEGKRCEMYDM